MHQNDTQIEVHGTIVQKPKSFIQCSELYKLDLKIRDSRCDSKPNYEMINEQTILVSNHLT